MAERTPRSEHGVSSPLALRETEGRTAAATDRCSPHVGQLAQPRAVRDDRPRAGGRRRRRRIVAERRESAHRATNGTGRSSAALPLQHGEGLQRTRRRTRSSWSSRTSPMSRYAAGALRRRASDRRSTPPAAVRRSRSSLRAIHGSAVPAPMAASIAAAPRARAHAQGIAGATLQARVDAVG
jgi:hypothetical protein